MSNIAMLIYCPLCKTPRVELVSEMVDKEITRLREALEFYATRENYYIDLSGAHGGVCVVQADNGEVAKQALQRAGGGE